MVEKIKLPILVQVFAAAIICLAFAAPFGTTILGWVAVAQIRRSEGKLHGRWLAVFDGLLFPLLAVDGLIVGAFYLGFLLADQELKRSQAAPIGIPFLLLIPIVLGAVALADFLIIRAVWRAVNKPSASGPSALAGSVRNQTGWPLLLLVLSLLAPFALILAVWSISSKRAADEQQMARGALQVELADKLATLLGEQRITYSFVTFDFVPEAPRIVIHYGGLQGWRGVTNGVPRMLRGDILLDFHPPDFWLVTGTRDLAKINSSLLTSAHGFVWWSESRAGHGLVEPTNPAAASTDMQNISFGPVIERTLVDSKSPFVSEAGRTNLVMMIDFDGGSVLGGPQIIWQADTDAQKRWMQTNGVDALCVVPGVGGLVVLDMKTLSVPPQTWEALSANLLDQLEHCARQDGTFTAPLNSQWSSPPTWLFQTREGATGILQITGFTGNPRGVKLRYKLVQTNGGKTEARMNHG